MVYTTVSMLTASQTQIIFIFIYLDLYFHCMPIWDFGMELKVRIIIFFGSIISYCECILAPFVVFS